MSVASCMLHKATSRLEEMQQSMFFVVNDVDRFLAIDRDHCSLQVALLKQDIDGVQLALGKLCEGNSPAALWKAASILQGGVLHCLLLSRGNYQYINLETMPYPDELWEPRCLRVLRD